MNDAAVVPTFPPEIIERAAEAMEKAGSRVLSGETRKTHQMRVATAALTAALGERTSAGATPEHINDAMAIAFGLLSGVNRADANSSNIRVRLAQDTLEQWLTPHSQNAGIELAESIIRIKNDNAERATS